MIPIEINDKIKTCIDIFILFFFKKKQPDGNYPDPVYCNIFHQCQAATDYPKRCSNRLMFREDKGECDWEDQVDCSGKEKLIETSGLEDESKPEASGDGKGPFFLRLGLSISHYFAIVY